MMEISRHGNRLEKMRIVVKTGMGLGSNHKESDIFSRVSVVLYDYLRDPARK